MRLRSLPRNDYLEQFEQFIVASKKGFFILIILLFPVDFLIAQLTEDQTFKKNKFGLEFGLATVAIQDPVFSPFIYSGPSAATVLKYNRLGKYFEHEISFQFQKNKLYSKISAPRNETPTFYSERIFGLFRYKILKTVSNKDNRKIEFYYGLSFNSFVDARRHFYNRSAGILGGEQSNSIQFLAGVRKSFSKLGLIGEFQVGVPFLAIVLMDGLYNTNVVNYKSDNVQGRLAFVGKFLECFPEISITKMLSEKIDLDLIYKGFYYRYRKHPDINSTILISHQVLLGLNFKF